MKYSWGGSNYRGETPSVLQNTAKIEDYAKEEHTSPEVTPTKPKEIWEMVWQTRLTSNIKQWKKSTFGGAFANILHPIQRPS